MIIRSHNTPNTPVTIPKAVDLAREVESLLNKANQEIISKIVEALNNCKITQSRCIRYTETLPQPVQTELKAAGYKVEHYSDMRDSNDSYYTISF